MLQRLFLLASFPALICLSIIPIQLSVAENRAQYPNTYQEARKEFLQALWGLKKASISFEHELLKVESEAYSELYTDSVYIAPLKIQKRIFILSSGVHGAEAPLGSALQTKFIRTLLPELNRDEDGVLILHALNPYGFYTGRRVTEANVDLNRNFLLSSDSFSKQSNTAYDEYRWLLASDRKIESLFLERLRLFFSFLGASLKGSREKQKLTRAFAQGQYTDPKGIYFGGFKHEALVGWVDKLLNKKLRGYAEVLHFDIHTGLGKASELQLISSLDTDLNSKIVGNLRNLYKKEEGIAIVSPRSEGFYVTSGDFIDYVYTKAVKLGLKAATFTAEFGTLGDDLSSKLKTTSRIILENRAHNYGVSQESDFRLLKKDFQELFNPTSSEWRNRVMEIGMRSLTKAMSRKEEQSFKKAQ